jgi:glycosyltransferase involved in cell wall biosynthesis
MIIERTKCHEAADGTVSIDRSYQVPELPKHLEPPAVKILALTKYSPRAASTRQRFVQYERVLAAAGITVDYSTFFDDDHLDRLVAGRGPSYLSVLRGYIRRLWALLFWARRYDGLWVHYEIFPYLPGVFERLGKWTGKPIIVDYDDATFHIYDSSPHALVRRFLSRKLVPLWESASASCCGNAYLQGVVSQHCPHTIVLPTVVDTARYVPASHEHDQPLVIGWIGSPSTWEFVRPLLPMLRKLVEEFGIIFRAVGAGDAARRDLFPGLDFVTWSEAREVAMVQSMDIGIMPVTDGKFERGKCGYKLVQYMACGIPVVASPVGVNRSIVETGPTGFLARDDSEWRDALVRLINDPKLRATLGQMGRSRAVTDFSLEGQANRLVEVFHSVIKAESR